MTLIWLAPLLGNDLQAAALSLNHGSTDGTLRAGVEAGALAGIVSGSGPTCAFLCADAQSAVEVDAQNLRERGCAAPFAWRADPFPEHEYSTMRQRDSTDGESDQSGKRVEVFRRQAVARRGSPWASEEG